MSSVERNPVPIPTNPTSASVSKKSDEKKEVAQVHMAHGIALRPRAMAVTKAISEMRPLTPPAIPSRLETRVEIKKGGTFPNLPTPSPALSAIMKRREKHLEAFLSPSQIKMLSLLILQNSAHWAQEALRASSLITKTITIFDSAVTLRIRKEGQILISLSKAGHGAVKTVLQELLWGTGELIAHARTFQGESQLKSDERIMKQYQGVEGFPRFHGVTYEYSVSPEKGDIPIESYGLMMEYFEEGNLSEEIAKKASERAFRTATPQSVSGYRSQLNSALILVNALSLLHADGLVHNDIKPENILLGHGRIALTDFGETCEPGRQCEFGTLEYLPPEVFFIATLRNQLDDNNWQLKDLESAQKQRPSNDNLLSIEILRKQNRGRSRIIESAENQLGPPKDMWAMGLTLYRYFFPSPHFVQPPIPPSLRGLNSDRYNKFLLEMESFRKDLTQIGERVPWKKPIVELIQKMIAFRPSDRISAAIAANELRSIFSALSKEV